MLSILQICNRFPFPPKDGGAIAMYNNTKAFYELGCKTDLLVINTKKHFVEVENLPKHFLQMVNQIEHIYANTNVNVWDAFVNLFSSESYNLKRFKIKDFERKLIHLLKNNSYDIIHIEGLFVSMYIDVIRKYSKAKICLRAHNVEYLIWHRMADSTKFFPKKIYLKLLAKRLKKYELSIINKVDALIPISQVDADFFINNGCRVNIFVCTAGVDESVIASKPVIVEEPSVFHLGALDWLPNLEAINWFLNHIWPKLHEKHPQIKFYLAGRNMPKKILELQLPGVEVLGEIQNAIDFLNSKSIMVVPLLSGSGMRVKIIEGMGMGKTIVSTTIGAEGINYTAGKHILIADTAESFIDQISYAIENPYVCRQIGENAIQLIRDNYSNKVLISGLIDFYKKISMVQPVLEP